MHIQHFRRFAATGDTVSGQCLDTDGVPGDTLFQNCCDPNGRPQQIFNNVANRPVAGRERRQPQPGTGIDLWYQNWNANQNFFLTQTS